MTVGSEVSYLARFPLVSAFTPQSVIADSLRQTIAGEIFLPIIRSTPGVAGEYPIVFVSRQIPDDGSDFYSQTGSLPGAGPYSRFTSAGPGKLQIREAGGTIRTLIDGSNPTAASLNLVDVNAPDVSYDATKIVFAGLPAGNTSPDPRSNPGAWRIYVINADGSGLRQVTFSDRNIDLSQFGSVGDSFTKYDDTDPIWLPDGRLVFSSTRWPSFGMYSAVRTTNLFVVNEDGGSLHRITSERNGAERPLVDPQTGRIVYSRWWRNFRTATNSMDTIIYPAEGYVAKDGLLNASGASEIGLRDAEVGGPNNLERNIWNIASINPDGTGLAQFAGRSNTFFEGQDGNQGYGGAFASDGTLYANYFPMGNMTEAAGFGGIRRYQRGPNGYTPIIGITHRIEGSLEFVRESPRSFGVYKGNYATDPVVLADGRLLISWAMDINQDYGLYIINPDGSGLKSVYNQPGTSQLRARLLLPRPLPPIISDMVTQTASDLPPLPEGPYNVDGTFTFNALNVYANGPVDSNILNAMPVGSAGTIRFFIDHQRDEQRGSLESVDWPILLQEIAVNPDGSVIAQSPANVPLFEQIRSPKPNYIVPLTGRGISDQERGGAAHVAGLNFGRPNEIQSCVGCHAGHTMIPVPENPADAVWTNLAPGAAITTSSTSSSFSDNNGLIDRRVKMQLPYNNYTKYWYSDSSQEANSQWVELTFPVPVTIRTVRLYNLPTKDYDVQVNDSTIKLFSDAAATDLIATTSSGALSESGTDVAFNDVRARVVRIEFTSVTGSQAGLAEIEVIARGEAGP